METIVFNQGARFSTKFINIFIIFLFFFILQWFWQIVCLPFIAMGCKVAVSRITKLPKKFATDPEFLSFWDLTGKQ